jgi:hypothetical protein
MTAAEAAAAAGPSNVANLKPAENAAERADANIQMFAAPGEQLAALEEIFATTRALAMNAGRLFAATYQRVATSGA